MEKEKKPVIKEQDLLELLSTLVANKRFIIRFTLIFFAFGILLTFTSVKKYTVEVMVAPESSETNTLAGNLGSLASMVGIDLGSSSGDAIYPLLYPEIVNSLPFLSSMMNVRVTTEEGIDTTYSYYQAELQKKFWFGEILKAPKKLVGAVAKLFKKKQPETDPYVFDPYRLSEKQLIQIEALMGNITVFVDKKTEVITLSFTDPNPEIAAVMAERMETELERRVTEYRTKKALKDCQYMENLYNESKIEYEKAQTEYAEFVDHNRNVTLERVLIERERLEDEKDLKNTLYSQWAQQLLLSQAKLQQHTPVFTTLKPAAVPALPSSLRRLYMLALYGILGFGLAICWVLLKKPVHTVINKIRQSDK
jgi:uncharacterized protein involved in exopolysaccharide biosynthesis